MSSTDSNVKNISDGTKTMEPQNGYDMSPYGMDTGQFEYIHIAAIICMMAGLLCSFLQYAAKRSYRDGEDEDRYRNKRRRRDSDQGEESQKFRKLFIGGLCYDTTDDELKRYFEQFGDVEDCIVMKETQTGRSRGFGFVTFTESKMLEDCQASRPHVIDGRQVETKRAMPRTSGNNQNEEVVKESVLKLFVGGVSQATTSDTLEEKFKQFGIVKHVELMMDKVTGRHRGFAFITFEDSDSVDKAVLKKHLDIDGQLVEVKKAESINSRKSRDRGMNNNCKTFGKCYHQVLWYFYVSRCLHAGLGVFTFMSTKRGKSSNVMQFKPYSNQSVTACRGSVH
ncbi:heteroproteinous nuclear ribonucleoprotein [Mactra antiquata]